MLRYLLRFTLYSVYDQSLPFPSSMLPQLPWALILVIQSGPISDTLLVFQFSLLLDLQVLFTSVLFSLNDVVPCLPM